MQSDNLPDRRATSTELDVVYKIFTYWEVRSVILDIDSAKEYSDSPTAKVAERLWLAVRGAYRYNCPGSSAMGRLVCSAVRRIERGRINGELAKGVPTSRDRIRAVMTPGKLQLSSSEMSMFEMGNAGAAEQARSQFWRLVNDIRVINLIHDALRKARTRYPSRIPEDEIATARQHAFTLLKCRVVQRRYPDLRTAARNILPHAEYATFAHAYRNFFRGLNGTKNYLGDWYALAMTSNEGFRGARFRNDCDPPKPISQKLVEILSSRTLRQTILHWDGTNEQHVETTVRLARGLDGVLRSVARARGVRSYNDELPNACRAIGSAMTSGNPHLDAKEVAKRRKAFWELVRLLQKVTLMLEFSPAMQSRSVYPEMPSQGKAAEALALARGLQANPHRSNDEALVRSITDILGSRTGTLGFANAYWQFYAEMERVRQYLLRRMQYDLTDHRL